MRQTLFSQVNPACVSCPIFFYSLIRSLFQVFPGKWCMRVPSHFFLFPNSHNSRVIHLKWPCQWILPFVTHKVFWKELKYFLFQNSLMLLKLQIHVFSPSATRSFQPGKLAEHGRQPAYWFSKIVLEKNKSGLALFFKLFLKLFHPFGATIAEKSCSWENIRKSRKCRS